MGYCINHPDRETSYMDEFTSALFLPHTNIANFPSVSRRMSV